MHLPAQAQNYHPNAAICDLPAQWNSNADTLRLVDILKLVIFYNDDFGINVDDPINIKRKKVREWLLGQD